MTKAWLPVVLILGASLLCWAVMAFDAERDGMDGMRALVRSRFPDVRQLSPAELAAWLGDTNRPAPQLLDVREPAEFRVSHLAGARQVDPGISAAKLVPTLAPGRPVVVYCSVGYRSSELATRLLRAGFTNIFNLEGSIFAWANEQRPLEARGTNVLVVHPYNETFGRLLRSESRAGKEAIKQAR